MAESEPGREAVLELDEGRVRPGVWLARHVQSLVAALGHLSRAPLASLMTTAVIGVALALPAALFVALDNLSRAAGGWQGAAEISVFLRPEVDELTARELRMALSNRPEVERLDVVSPEAALAEYRALTGDSGALRALGERNPLPWLLVLHVEDAHARQDRVDALVSELEQRPQVDTVSYDLQWLDRLQALMALGRRGTLVLGTVLALTVLLVVGNTIRLEIERRRAEMDIIRLVGGTDAFVRRPFLYTGGWYGLFGGLLALALLFATASVLAAPVADLSRAYGSRYTLAWPGLWALVAVPASGAALGLVGAWIAVGRYLVRDEGLAASDL